MQRPLEIVFREMLPLPSMEPEIRRRAAKLEVFGGELTRCRVVVEAGSSRRHRGHEYQVMIDVHLPGEEVAVSQHHRGDDATLALRAAFDAMDRSLDERARQRRDGPRHGPAADRRP
jgi:ribosome-associated translation inhibitor RaiA